MRRVLVMTCAAAALAVGMVTGATAAPLGAVNQADTVGAGSDLLKVYYRGGGRVYGYRSRGPSFGFYLGAPAYYAYRNCWWSHRWHRRVCTY
jgi:hypothetical protein